MSSTDRPATSNLRPDGTVFPPVIPDPPDPPGYHSPVDASSALSELVVGDRPPIAPLQHRDS